MPRSVILAARDGKDPVRPPGGRRPAWPLAALIVLLLAAPRAAAQPELRFSPIPEPKSSDGTLRELRLRPQLPTTMFLHVHQAADTPPADYKVVLYAGKDPLATASVKVGKGINRVKFGEAPPPKDGKPVPLPLAETDGPLSFRLLDAKDEKVDEIEVGVAAPKEYVIAEQPTFTLAPASEEKGNGQNADGPTGVLQVTLRALPTFRGLPARVELVLAPERMPYLVPGQKKQGSYAGVLDPEHRLVLRAENLQLKAGKLNKGLFYVTVDGYPRAFAWVSSVSGQNTPSTPQTVTARVVRLEHPPFAKPGAKLPVTVEVDNMTGKDTFCTLGMYRKVVTDDDGNPTAATDPDGLLKKIVGDRVKLILFNPKGPAGAIVFDSKVRDHSLVFDTAELFGVRYLGLQMINQPPAKEKDKEKAPAAVLDVLNSKKIPALGLTKGFTKLVAEPVLLYEGGPILTLGVNLKAAAPGKLPELRVGEPLPLKASALDPTGVVKAMFFQGKLPADGKLPPGAVEGEEVPGSPGVWAAELPAPTTRAAVLTVGVQVTNGVNQTKTETIRIQLVDPKLAAGAGAGSAVPKLATVTGVVLEGDRPTPGVPVTLREDKGDLKAGDLKAATITDAAGAYKFEKVAPGVYRVGATRSASMTRGQTLISVPVGAELVDKNTAVKLTR